MLVAAVGVFTIWAFATQAYPFLATTERVPARILVVEGWLHEYAIRAAVEEFRRGDYRLVVTTGGPVEGIGTYINDYSTSASIAAGRLKQAGLPPDVVAMAPSRVSARDRTYGAALALRQWLRQNAPDVRSVNVLTADVHARRSRLLFSHALGDNVAVGIIAVPSPDYDPRRWWRYSEGVRGVLDETVGYAYARLYFVPTLRTGRSSSQ